MMRLFSVAPGEVTSQNTRRQDCAAIQTIADNPDVARLMMGFPFRTIGDVLRPNSRWRNANPLPAAGIDLDSRKTQLV